ncbi:MAG: hypothetical protein EBS29_11710, partial [Chloroflexia bacterium]|nr:hypothetical protein [Chloroflexia bacterium]
KELIPQGICFIQLWSAALLVQGIVEGVCGIAPNLRKREVIIAPQLPADWPEVRLTQLPIGGWMLDIVITQHHVTIELSGDPLDNGLTVWVVSPDGRRQSKTLHHGFSEAWSLINA